jgi:hypothetical protein
MNARLTVALLSLLLLAGCGSTPVFLGDADDGATFIARLTQFRGETALPGVLHALTNRGIEAAGCQLSMRGTPPVGVSAALFAGDCTAQVAGVFEQDAPAGDGYSGWMP